MVFDADGGEPRSSHTFATFVKATAKGSKEQDDQLEAHAISWMPGSLEIAVLRRMPVGGVLARDSICLQANPESSRGWIVRVREDLFPKSLNNRFGR
jgi:hypothetical protein